MQVFSTVTLGSSLTRISNPRFAFTETVHTPNLSLGRHSHEHASLACVLRGSYTESIADSSYECTRRTLLLKPAGEGHLNNYHRAGARTLLIEILPAMRSMFPELSKILDRVEFLEDRSTRLTAERIYNECRIGDSASEVAAEGLTLELLSRIARRRCTPAETGTPIWLERAVEFIHSHFTDTITLAELASEVDIDPSHLARTFRQKHDCTIGEYIRRLRISYAAELLVSTDRSLAEISASAGFYDQSHFTRTFKEHLGATPGRYRARSV